jgi:hypothetical protein
MHTFFIIYCIWAVVGFIYFLGTIGRKNEPDKWYDWVIMTPMITILYPCGFVGWALLEIADQISYWRRYK